MKYTTDNTEHAPGYTNDNGRVRICPYCHGDGIYLGNPTGGVARELKCEKCDGFGLVVLDEEP